MDIAFKITRGVLGLFIGLAINVWIIVGAANLTVANRDTAKQWLAGSGVYENALASVLQVSATDGQSTVTTPDVLREALTKTFDAAYLRQGTNTVIDATYNWLEGKASAITFSIPVQEKATEFREKLIALIVPKLQALPACPSKVSPDTNNITCLPQGVSAADYAAQLTRPSSDNTFLGEPLTEKVFQQNQAQTQASLLPTAFSWMRLLFWVLPITILVLAAGYVLASPDKLRGVSRIGRQFLFGSAVALIGGLALWLASPAIDLSQTVEGGDAQQTQILAGLINPLIHIILPDIGRALSLCSGALVMLGGLLWLGVFVWKRSRPKGPNISTPSPTASSSGSLPE